jgi:hypothetical protein
MATQSDPETLYIKMLEELNAKDIVRQADHEAELVQLDAEDKGVEVSRKRFWEEEYDIDDDDERVTLAAQVDEMIQESIEEEEKTLGEREETVELMSLASLKTLYEESLAAESALRIQLEESLASKEVALRIQLEESLANKEAALRIQLEESLANKEAALRTQLEESLASKEVALRIQLEESLAKEAALRIQQVNDLGELEVSLANQASLCARFQSSLANQITLCAQLQGFFVNCLQYRTPLC